MANKIRYGKVQHPNGPGWGTGTVVVRSNRPKLSEEELAKVKEKRTYLHSSRKKDKAPIWYPNAKKAM